MKIAMIGTGYVGLVAGVCFADAGHHVECVDRDESKIKTLRAGQSPIFEPGLEDLMKLAIKAENIQFTTDLQGSIERNDLIFVAVGTPEGADGEPDLRALNSVVDSISKWANRKKYVVLKSTVPVGTAQSLQATFAKSCKHPIEVINNPEFLKEGAAVDDFLRPDRVIIGCSSLDAQQMMEELYEPFVKNGHPIYFMDNVSAEMTKYAANAFLSVKISFINELAQLADKVGADINQIRKGFTSDRRINPAFFYPGVGYGGSCFPKDVQALMKTGNKNGITMQIIEAADEVNNKQRRDFFNKIQKHFGSLQGKTIALWGLSFKPRTDDVREAPALDLITWLTKEGATVRAYDPIAGENAKSTCQAKFDLGAHPLSVTEGADALVVVTEWNEFRNPDFEKLKKNLKTPVIFDGRNIFEPRKLRQLGFKYYCFGRENLPNAGSAKWGHA
jgi:UDPglucose 6-dehydrogenase